MVTSRWQTGSKGHPWIPFSVSLVSPNPHPLNSNQNSQHHFKICKPTIFTWGNPCHLQFSPTALAFFDSNRRWDRHSKAWNMAGRLEGGLGRVRNKPGNWRKMMVSWVMCLFWEKTFLGVKLENARMRTEFIWDVSWDVSCLGVLVQQLFKVDMYYLCLDGNASLNLSTSKQTKSSLVWQATPTPPWFFRFVLSFTKSITELSFPVSFLSFLLVENGNLLLVVNIGNKKTWWKHPTKFCCSPQLLPNIALPKPLLLCPTSTNRHCRAGFG